MRAQRPGPCNLHRRALFPALHQTERLIIDDLHCELVDFLLILQKFRSLKQLTLYPPPKCFRWTLLRLPTFLTVQILCLFMENADVRDPIYPQRIEDEAALYCSQTTDSSGTEKRTVLVRDWKLSRNLWKARWR